FHLGGINILAAGDDHVALAVDEMNVAVLVAAGEITDRAIVATESVPSFFGQLPVAVKRIGVARVELAWLAVAHIVAVYIENSDGLRPDAFAAHRAEFGELLVRV